MVGEEVKKLMLGPECELRFEVESKNEKVVLEVSFIMLT
jgi:hypothetical protein